MVFTGPYAKAAPPSVVFSGPVAKQSVVPPGGAVAHSLSNGWLVFACCTTKAWSSTGGIFWSLSKGCSFVSLAEAATSIIFVATKQTHVCRNKNVFVWTKHVFCRDTIMFAATKLLSRQNIFVATSILL